MVSGRVGFALPSRMNTDEVLYRGNSNPGTWEPRYRCTEAEGGQDYHAAPGKHSQKPGIKILTSHPIYGNMITDVPMRKTCVLRRTLIRGQGRAGSGGAPKMALNSRNF